MYRRLLQYRERHGDTLVLTNKESSTDAKKLGKWAQNQRVHYKYFCNGDRKHIKEHRIEALNQVGFVWNVLEHAWNTNFTILSAYYEEHGNFDVPHKHSAKLNSFVTNLRKAMRRKKEGLFQKELTEERIDRLNAINFKWELKHPARQRSVGEGVQFAYLFGLLADFKKTYGHIQVSKMLGVWRGGDEKPARKEYTRLPFFMASVKNEHALFVRGKPCALDEEKIRKLAELGVKWKKPASEPRLSSGYLKRKRKSKGDTNVDADAGEAVKIDEVDEVSAVKFEDAVLSGEQVKNESALEAAAVANVEVAREDMLAATLDIPDYRGNVEINVQTKEANPMVQV